MARIRSIHPEQWTDDQFVTTSPLARLVALGIRNEADDNGVFEWNPIKLKMRLLPADNCDMDSLLGELLSTKQVWRYEVDGRQYAMIRSFQRYQKPKKPTFYHPIPSEQLPNGYALNHAYTPASSEPVTHQYGIPPSDGEGREGEKGMYEKTTPSNEGVPQTAPDDPEKIRVPYALIVESYRTILVPLGLPDVVRLTDARKAHIRQRWLLELPTLLDWEKYWNTVAASAFLTGKARASPGKLPFVASIDWLITPSNLIKVLEGNYADGTRKQASEDRGRAGRFHDKLREYALEDAEGVGGGALCEAAGSVRN